jgi:UPF0716 protein FxsA
MLGRLFLTFSIVTLLELAILIPLGQWMGVGPTILLVIATGFIGAWLAKCEGIRAWTRFQKQAQQGEVPTEPILDGLAIFAAALFLMTPGVLTDIVGVLLLIPVARKPLKAYLRRRAKAFTQSGSGGSFTFFSISSGSNMRGQNPFEAMNQQADPRRARRKPNVTVDEPGAGDSGFKNQRREVKIRDVEFIDKDDDDSESATR